MTTNAGDKAKHAAGKVEQAGDKAEQAGNSKSLAAVARVGLIAYGAVHVLIAWLALQIAWGLAGNQSADTSGAMKTLAQQPFGKILLGLVAVGLIALALWQATHAIWGYRNHVGTQRIREQITSAAKALAYTALGISAASIALGSQESSSQTQQHATSGVLAWPGGRVLVVAAGLIIIGVGVASVVKGVKQSFTEEINTSSMSPTVRKGVARLGQVGYVAKGAALGVVGGLLSYATLTFDPQKAQGLDGALQTILAQPFGRFLLTAVALGFLAFGLFAILQARYRRM
jgi:fumarate reductase subunit D